MMMQILALLAEAVERLPAWVGPNDEANAWRKHAAMVVALAAEKEPSL
jgi:hypothetical protein